jgi:dethiobiotin synthetase
VSPDAARGIFVTGTGTGVGKTLVSAALIAAIAAAGERVGAHKPVVTGLDEPPGDWPPDHELLGLLAGIDPAAVAPLRYHPAVSPHLAARLAGEPIDPAEILSRARAALAREPITVIEGVGGLLVPLAEEYTVCDLAVELELPVVIVAAPGLGTINHTLLTVRVARACGLRVCAVVLTPWPASPSQMERSNHQTIARLGEVEVHGLPPLPGPDPSALAVAGASLPWRGWLSR